VSKEKTVKLKVIQNVSISLGYFIFSKNHNELPEVAQWRKISHKQSARWQHLSSLKASAFFSLKKNLLVKKLNNLYMGLVTLAS
jgi:hypothetical protein